MTDYLNKRNQFSSLDFRLSIILTMILIGFSSLALAQSKKLDRMLERERNKEYKKKMRSYKKNRMKITGTSRSLEVALLTHYGKLSEGYDEIQVMTNNCPTMNLCARKALTDACSEYATLANSFLKGRVASELGMDASESNQVEQDKFYAAYEQKVSANLSGVLKRSFSAYKEQGGKKNKAYTYESYFLVESDAAKSARQKAMQQALTETKASVEWGKEISKFVNEEPEKK